MHRALPASADIIENLRARLSHNRFSTTTYIVAVAAAGTSAALLWQSPGSSIFVLAILFGWSELNGMCGMSHLGTLTPMRALDEHGGVWLRAVAAYTFSGVLTAGLVGAAVGWLGHTLRADQSPLFVLMICGLALILAARELECIRFALPQVPLQTQKMWQFQFGIVTGAAMWGAHIGLGVATVIAHGGFFVVLAFTAFFGPSLGALLMICYWIGRTLPLWAATQLVDDPVRGPSVVDCVLSSPKPYRHAAAIGLLCASFAALCITLGQPS